MLELTDCILYRDLATDRTN